MMACLFMIAYHTGSKAFRDAFFLTKFDIKSLPAMVIVASLFSIVAVLASSRAIMKIGPARLMPVSFGISAAMQIVIWFAIDEFPRACAVILYLQSVALGSLLTSGFWSMINERFDPRTVKQLVGRIAGAGTLGGMMSGIITERVGAKFHSETMLPVLGAFHIACALLLLVVKRGMAAPPAANQRTDDEPRGPSGLEILNQAPYLKTLAALVILGTISAAMIDYVFKSSARAFYGPGDNLLRFFALVNAVTGVLTFAVQTALSSVSLRRLGIARTVGTLPFAVSFGGFGALVLGGLPAATIARGLEAVFRGSLFRSGFELFYTSMPTQEKRAAKSIVDVGFDRMGDAVGFGLVSLLLMLGPAIAAPAILTVSILVALAGIFVASRLQGAYIDALEHGLRERGGEYAALEDINKTGAMTAFMDSLTILDAGRIGRPEEPSRNYTAIGSTRPPRREEEESPPTVVGATALNDPVVQQVAVLRSGNADKILRFLEANPKIKPHLVPHVMTLLGWDRVSNEVTAALRRVAESHTGQLTDALLDQNTEFAIRRRIPRVLSVVSTPRVAAGVIHGLNDRRFEVRFQCGRALAAMMANNQYLKFNPEEIYGAIRREVAVSRPVWESQRLLDRSEDTENSPFVDEFLRDRTNRSLQHLFTLLALIHPPEPLNIAYHGLHADDEQLRGTALEYLESILPADIRSKLWPLLDRPEPENEPVDKRSREDILAELIKSSHSVMVRLEELQKKPEEPAS